MLEMTGICKSYESETIVTRALHDIDLEVEEGEFVAVVGPSGSGKSTFMNVVGLLESSDSGTYVLDGEDVSRLNDRRRSFFRNQKIGFIFQNFNLIDEINVFDNVDLPLRYRGMKAKRRKNRVNYVLDLVGLGGRKKHLPMQLSGGQQQRVAIARALAGEPKLLLADEPTGNLDSRTAEGVFDLLLDLHGEGATVLMVTHDAVLASAAQREIYIHDGKFEPKTEAATS